MQWKWKILVLFYNLYTFSEQNRWLFLILVKIFLLILNLNFHSFSKHHCGILWVFFVIVMYIIPRWDWSVSPISRVIYHIGKHCTIAMVIPPTIPTIFISAVLRRAVIIIFIFRWELHIVMMIKCISQCSIKRIWYLKCVTCILR